MSTIWRIAKKKHQQSAFDGEGARLFGGRWNLAGTPVVYCSENLSLAALETFVHLDRWSVAFDLIAIPVEIPMKVSIKQYSKAELDKLFKKTTAAELGTQWVNTNESAVLAVPSAIIAQENNYILNPQHPDFAKLNIQLAEKFVFDQRMLK